MIYVKFNFKATWFYYGPWKDIAVHYNCPRRDRDNATPVFKIGFTNENTEICVDEIFAQDTPIENGSIHSGYTIITGYDENGKWCAIALSGCQAYLLTREGKTLDRI
jgi:hypothetical protein